MKKIRTNTIPLFYFMTGIILIALLFCGVMTYYLYAYHADTMWKRQMMHKINMLRASAVSRLGAPLMIKDYEEVDRIMTDLFGYEVIVNVALIVDRESGKVFYDINDDHEGEIFSDLVLPKNTKYKKSEISLGGGFGFVVPEKLTIADLIIGFEYSNVTKMLEETSLKDYSRALISDINKKINSKNMESARITAVNMCANSKKIKYVQWLDNNGVVFVNSYKNRKGELVQGEEGQKLDDPVVKTALQVKKRRPLLIQLTTDMVGRSVYDIAMPLMRGDKKIGILRVGYSNKGFLKIGRKSERVMAWLIGVFIVFSLVLAGFASYLVASPLGKLASVVRRTAHEEHKTGGHIRTNIKEIESLVEDFENMIRDAKRAEREKEAMQQQLFQSQKMESIGLLAGGIAHDFNNILTVIKGNASMLRRKQVPRGEAEMMLDDILDSSERARDLTMKLLYFSRKDRLNVKPVRVDDIVENVSRIMERSMVKTTRITTKIEPGLFVKVDKNQVIQALINICQNACDAMTAGGTIRITCMRVRAADIPSITGARAPDEGLCLIKVSDSGTGIDEETLRNIFDPFFTTKDIGKGTGLGLSVARGIIANHDGFIDVRSAPGEGTDFLIYLPVSDETPETIEVKKYHEAEGGKETILVVDDDELVLSLTGRILKAAGYSVFTVENGMEAPDVFEKHSEEIALVVLDMVMPGISGKEVFEIIRKLDPDMRVLLASGYSVEGEAEELLKNNNVEFIQKPFEMENLLKTVRSILDKKG